jgi:Na+(H+)/acetate symporter ActP
MLVLLVVVSSVSVAGVRSITSVQTFQYCVKITAITIPLVFVGFAWYENGHRP